MNCDIPKLQYPTIRPDLVRGYMGHATSNPPDRIFKVLLKGVEDIVFEIDGYKSIDGINNKENWVLHLLCPKCRNVLMMDSMKKNIEISDKGIRTEPFQCSYGGDFGQNLCSCRVALDFPSKSDLNIGVIRTNGIRYQTKVDAIFKIA